LARGQEFISAFGKFKAGCIAFVDARKRRTFFARNP
jgi:hypothetical protein